MLVKIKDLIIPEDSQRKVYEGIEELATSIVAHGLIHPIVIEKETNKVIVGRRRIKAYEWLERDEIEAMTRENLSEWERKSIELEENIKRQNLTYAEECEAKLQLHELYQQKYGETVGAGERGGRREKGGHTLKDTSIILNEAEGKTKQDIQLAKAIRNNPELAKKDTKSAAFKAMKNEGERGIREKIAQILAEDAKERGEEEVRVIFGNALTALKEIEDESVDFCVTDPPYLVGIDSSHDLTKTWDMRVDDGVEKYEEICAIFKELARVLKEGAHCYVFFATMRWEETRKMLEGCGLWHSPIPLIWVKGKVAPIDPYHMFASRYEPIFYGSKGKPRAFTTHLLPDNVLSYNVPGKKIHPTQKPVGVYTQLIENCSLEGELGIDPFAGSGTFGRACKRLKRRGILIEKDPECYTKCIESVNSEGEGEEESEDGEE